MQKSYLFIIVAVVLISGVTLYFFPAASDDNISGEFTAKKTSKNYFSQKLKSGCKTYTVKSPYSSQVNRVVSGYDYCTAKRTYPKCSSLKYKHTSEKYKEPTGYLYGCDEENFVSKSQRSSDGKCQDNVIGNRGFCISTGYSDEYAGNSNRQTIREI